ncbi:MAG: ankyrin repeat domain-containing protein, partial [Pseudomonadota bacterium]
RTAVDLMDRGDARSLADHLERHPGLTGIRVELGTEDYFASPYLLSFIAENPVRYGRVPETVLDVLDVLIAAGSGTEALNETLALVSSGRVMRESGRQGAVIARLCDAGADPDVALLTALGHGEFGAVKALIQAGAAKTLPWAASIGDLEATDQLLSKASQLERHQALALAATHGQTAPLERLLAAGEDPNRFNPPGCHAHTTPLHQAAWFGHLDVVKALVEAGARTDIPDKSHGGPALGWAQHGGQPHVEAYLASLNQQEP